jgi:SAM-dependent methyltransferase
MPRFATLAFRAAICSSGRSTALKGSRIGTAAKASQLGLAPHEGREKNWDAFRAYSFVVTRGLPRTAVLDMGSATYGVILPWLHLSGWRDLHGCDISFSRAFRRASIEYTPQNIERTSYAPGRFDFVTCLSVIEHGVDLAAFLREAARVLKPGGHLLVSTDYWREPLPTHGRYDPRYNCPLKVFSEDDIAALLQTASECGLRPTEAVDTSCEERVVYWERLDLRYTFLFLARRRGHARPCP